MNKKEPLKCLYIYDNRFIKHLGNVYTKLRINDSTFERYVDLNDSITVITRMEYSSDIYKATILTLPNLKFRPIKGLLFSKAFTIYLIYNLQLFNSEIRKADFIVVRLPSFLGVFGLIVNLYYKKKYFIEVAGDAESALLTSREKPSIAFRSFTKIFFKLNRYFIKNADGAIYVTKSALQNKYPTRGFSNYASNVELKVPDINFDLERYKANESTLRIGMIADYNNPYKGVKEAIQSINILKGEGYNVNLYIVGSGSLLEYYQQLATELEVGENTIFKGRLKANHEILEWLASLDLYIQPSYTEGLPRALVEAMSVGLPAIATNVGGIPELIDEKYLVPPYDAKLLAVKMSYLLDSEILRVEAGIRNHQVAKEYDHTILNQRRTEFWSKARSIL